MIIGEASHVIKRLGLHILKQCLDLVYLDQYMIISIKID